MLETIATLTRSGISFIVSTHDPSMVAAADRTMLIRHGALEAETHQSRLLSVIDQSGLAGAGGRA